MVSERIQDKNIQSCKKGKGVALKESNLVNPSQGLGNNLLQSKERKPKFYTRNLFRKHNLNTAVIHDEQLTRGPRKWSESCNVEDVEDCDNSDNDRSPARNNKSQNLSSDKDGR